MTSTVSSPVRVGLIGGGGIATAHLAGYESSTTGRVADVISL